MISTIEFLTKAQEICKGEEFEELRKKDKQKVFDLFMDTDAKKEFDGDGDGGFAFARVGEVSITFSSYAEYLYAEDIRACLIGLKICVDGEESDFETAIKWLENEKQQQMPLALLNTSILTAPGEYVLEDITLEEAKELVSKNELDSAIGHDSTAKVMTTLLDVEVPVNRQMFCQQPAQKALVFKLNGRPEEGKILTVKEIEAIGYKFQLLKRIR